MAGLGRKVFEANEVLTAADVNGYLMDQAVMVFDDSAARTAAIGTPTEGMASYLKDTNSLELFDGSSWVGGGDITSVTAGTALSGGGASGDVTLNVDLTAVQENVITTEGDLVVGNASGEPARLPVGSANQVLTSNGTTVSFQDPAGGGSDWTVLATGTLSGAIVSVTGLTAKNRYYVELAAAQHSGNAITVIRFNGVTSDGDGINATVENFSSFNTGMVYATNAGNAILYENADQNSDAFAALLVENAQTSGTKLCNFKGAGSFGSSSGQKLHTGFFTTPSGVGAITSIQIDSAINDFTGGAYRILGAD